MHRCFGCYPPPVPNPPASAPASFPGTSTSRSTKPRPPENSIRYAREADCALYLIDGDHALNGSLEVVAGLFEGFLGRATA